MDPALDENQTELCVLILQVKEGDVMVSSSAVKMLQFLLQCVKIRTRKPGETVFYVKVE